MFHCTLILLLKRLWQYIDMTYFYIKVLSRKNIIKSIIINTVPIFVQLNANIILYTKMPPGIRNAYYGDDSKETRLIHLRRYIFEYICIQRITIDARQPPTKGIMDRRNVMHSVWPTYCSQRLVSHMRCIVTLWSPTVFCLMYSRGNRLIRAIADATSRFQDHAYRNGQTTVFPCPLSLSASIIRRRKIKQRNALYAICIVLRI